MRYSRSESPTTKSNKLSVIFPHLIIKEERVDHLLVNASKTYGIMFISIESPTYVKLSTYASNLVSTLNRTFNNSFAYKSCLLENEECNFSLDAKYILNRTTENKYLELANLMNNDPMIQLFIILDAPEIDRQKKENFLAFLRALNKPLLIVLNSTIPPAKNDVSIKFNELLMLSDSIVIRNNLVAKVLMDEFQIAKEKLQIIPLETHYSLENLTTTYWENAAISYVKIFEIISNGTLSFQYRIPPIQLDHLIKMTTEFGIIQFANLSLPDHKSGYTLEDNARAMIVFCHHFKSSRQNDDLTFIIKYFDFIKFCFQSEGYFMNHVDNQKTFTQQNNSTNLADANGTAIWAIGYLISLASILPGELIAEADDLMMASLSKIATIHSNRAIALTIKGLCFYNETKHSIKVNSMITLLADRLVQSFRNATELNWNWFESYVTYANSMLPESLLYAFEATGDIIYKDIAISSFEFLLEHSFEQNYSPIISKKKTDLKEEKQILISNQPVENAYQILTFDKFYQVVGDQKYYQKMELAFDWFLGRNQLNHIVYNPSTHGCYDSVEKNHVNLNQGAASTISYHLARLTMEQYILKMNFSDKNYATMKGNYERKAL